MVNAGSTNNEVVLCLDQLPGQVEVGGRLCMVSSFRGVLGLPDLCLDGQVEPEGWLERNEALGELFLAALPASLNILALHLGPLNMKMIGLKFISPLQRKL